MPVKDMAAAECVCVVGYSLDTIWLKWIDERENAVQFDSGGKDESQFEIKQFHLNNCSTDGLAHRW